jgi:hypothetical protein
VTALPPADASATAAWTTAKGPEGFVSLSNQEPYLELLSNPETFSVTHRVGAYGPVVVAEIGTATDMEIHCGSLRST